MEHLQELEYWHRATCTMSQVPPNHLAHVAQLTCYSRLDQLGPTRVHVIADPSIKQGDKFMRGMNIARTSPLAQPCNDKHLSTLALAISQGPKPPKPHVDVVPLVSHWGVWLMFSGFLLGKMPICFFMLE